VKTVSKGKLKAKMLEYFREVERTGEPLVVTDHGRPVLEVRPVAGKQVVTAQDVLEWYGQGGGPGVLPDEEELMKPMPWEDWEALREDDRHPW
jgi:prevent-host-death family protein